MDYPAPAHSAYIWIADGEIWLAFPGTGPSGQGHSIHVPADTRGLNFIVKTLEERQEAAKRRSSLAIANPGAPTQWDYEQIARAVAKAPAKPPKADKPIKFEELFNSRVARMMEKSNG